MVIENVFMVATAHSKDLEFIEARRRGGAPIGT